MNAPTALAPLANAAQASVVTQPASELDRLLMQPFQPRDILEDRYFDKILRLAEALAMSAMSIPKELKGNVGDCMAIVTQALIWGMNPFAVAQAAHVINGKLGYEAKLVNAVVMNSGAIVGGFRYEYRGAGADLECRVGAVLRGESDVTWNEWYASRDVVVRNSPLWKTNPRQQLGYLQVKNWARAFAPGAILGVYSVDELQDAAGETNLEPDAALARGPQRRSVTNAGPEASAPPPPAVDPPAPVDHAAAPAPSSASAPLENGSRPQINAGQVAYLRNKLKTCGIAESAVCARYEVGAIEELSLDAFDEQKSELLRNS